MELNNKICFKTKIWKIYGLKRFVANLYIPDKFHVYSGNEKGDLTKILI